MKITHVTTRALRTAAGNPLMVGLPAPNRAHRGYYAPRSELDWRHDLALNVSTMLM